MFTYLHCYMPETWEAQVRAGLVRPHHGIRFSQSIDIPEELKFNRLAAIGGDLYNYVKETRCPFYIDRLQGGCFLEQYPYDMGLVDEYRTMLGDKFWGFQMHEWGSNLRSDLGKITEGGCTEWTAPAIANAIRRVYPYEHLFVEAMSAEEYASMGGIPETWQDYLAVMETLFRSRQTYTGGDLLPCDSYFQAQKMETDNGAKRLMPELGAQTPNIRIQVALTRGMAKAAGIPFGTYYEPWGGSPFSACCYEKDGRNEWNISAESFPFQTAGGNGGSSRSLQHRIHLYSYMAGAEFMAEEWGMCNTFLNWETFPLSPYGQVKKDFLDFVDRHPEIGTPVTPSAVVLPKEMRVLDMALSPDTYLHYPVEGTFAEALGRTVHALRHLFADSAPMCGTEQKNLKNGFTPDAVDIIYEDSPTVGDYPILVDCTANPAFAAVHGDRCVTPEEAREALNRVLPLSLEGGASAQFTRREDIDGWYVLLLNNSGVERSVEQGEVFLPEGEIRVVLRPNPLMDGKVLTVVEGTGAAVRAEDGSYRVTIPAGGWLFGEIG